MFGTREGSKKFDNFNLFALTEDQAPFRFSASPMCVYLLNKKMVSVKQKTRGRPATGQTPLMGFRASDKLRAAIIKWAEGQPDMPRLSEALRRLVELGLTVKSPPRRSNDKQKARAKELAGSAIDKLSEVAATPDEKASRKTRLIKGPEEFREARVDRTKKRSPK